MQQNFFRELRMKISFDSFCRFFLFLRLLFVVWEVWLSSSSVFILLLYNVSYFQNDYGV